MFLFQLPQEFTEMSLSWWSLEPPVQQQFNGTQITDYQPLSAAPGHHIFDSLMCFYFNIKRFFRQLKVQYHRLWPRWRHSFTSAQCASSFISRRMCFNLRACFFHSLCLFALKVLARCPGSSSRSRLPGSVAASEQLCFNSRPPGSEFTLWFSQHLSVLLAGFWGVGERMSKGATSRLYYRHPGGLTERCGCGGRAAGG